MDQLDRDQRQPIGQPAGIAVLESNVLAFQIAKVAQAVPEGVPDGRIVDDANTRGSSPAAARAPRVAKQQPRRRAAS